MKLLRNLLMEDDRMDAIKKAAEASKARAEEEFRDLGNSIDPNLIAVLNYIINRKRSKKNVEGVTSETWEDLRAYGLVGAKQELTPKGIKFAQWWENNPNREMQYRQDRAQADISLGRGAARRREDASRKYADPGEVKAAKLLRSFDSEEEMIINKLARKTFNKKYSGLASKWFSENETEFLEYHDILDADGRLTEFGKLVVGKYALSKAKYGDKDSFKGRLSSKGRLPRR